uniref:Clc-like protein 2 n=1 Tax=Angiostrongylus cantonensis TaxID=6313 RepID=A0A0K0DRF4_ANGCA
MASPKIFLLAPTVMCIILGLILLFIALATPAWQVVYARELQQWLQSGLWMSCQTRPSGMHMCSYAFAESDLNMHANVDILNIRPPTFYSWQRNLLHVFFVGQLCAVLCLISLCFSQTPSVEKAASVITTVFAAFAALICCGSNVAFIIFSYMVEYRFLQVSVSGIYEKHRGYSFYVAVCGSLLYVVAFFFSLTYTIHVLRKDRYLGGNVDLGRTMVGEM